MDPSDIDLDDLTRWIESAVHGDEEAMDRITPIVYPRLCAIAKGFRRRQGTGLTLQTIDIVHEAYLRLFKRSSTNGRAPYVDRSHFYAVSARAMRCVLVDHARRKKRQPKRDPIPLDELVEKYAANAGDLELLDNALQRLKLIDPLAERIVNLRFMLDLPIKEIAQLVGSSQRTVERKLWAARALLRAEVERGSRALGED